MWFRAAGGRGTVVVAGAAMAAGLLVAAPVDDAGATVSGQDGVIAYAGLLNNDYDLYVTDPAGGAPTNLTNTPSDPERDPAWSPAGGQLAFARGEAHYDIWVMNADGSEATNLTPGPNDGLGNSGRWPTWSPDGLQIAYADAGELWTMNADGSDKQTLTATPEVESDPVWSPDGERIVYVRNLDLWIMEADGSNQELLVSSGEADRSPDWAPDGSSIVYDRGGEIYQVDADGTDDRVLISSGEGGGVTPSYSPQGNHVAFSTSGFGANNGPGIAVVGVDGSDPHVVAGATTLTDLDPSWQPVVESVNLTATVTDSPDPARIDEPVSYQVTVANQSHGRDARFTTLSMLLPSGASFGSATPDQGTCKRRRGTVTCSLGTLAGRTSTQVTLVVTPKSTFDLALAGSVSAGHPDPSPADNSFQESTEVLPPPGAAPRALVTWSVPDRYADHDGDGFLDENRFINPKGLKVPFEMVLQGCDSSPVGSITNYRFAVTLPNGEVLKQSSASCDFAFNPPKEGRYPVKLKITTSGGETVTTQQEVPFRDYLIVSLGDSIASGEGNPDKICDQGCHAWDPPETWQNRACHRSALSGPSQAAWLLEANDPTTSVTFAHLACSGGQVTAGILNSWPGIEPDGDKLVPAQADVMEKLLNGWGRKPDAVLVSIGANDAQFAEAVKECLNFGRCQNNAEFVQKVEQRLSLLPDRYKRLDKRLDSMGIPGGKVFITEYPDVTKNEKGEYVECVPNLYPSELKWAAENVVDPLNEHVRKAANKDAHGWNVVGGINSGFRDHGYCSASNWIVRLEQSIDWQGDINGSFHPNNAGHAFYGRQIAAVLRRKFG